MSVLLAAAAAGMHPAVSSLRSAGSGNNRNAHRPRVDTELQREIAAHNEAVDRRRAEKKAAKRNRKTQEPTT